MHWIDISDEQDGSRFINLERAEAVVELDPEEGNICIDFGHTADDVYELRGDAARRLLSELRILADRAALDRAEMHAQNQRDMGFR